MVKSEVVRELVLKFRLEAKILVLRANVKEARFDKEYFKGFDVVLNGLDNLEV